MTIRNDLPIEQYGIHTLIAIKNFSCNITQISRFIELIIRPVFILLGNLLNIFSNVHFNEVFQDDFQREFNPLNIAHESIVAPEAGIVERRSLNILRGINPNLEYEIMSTALSWNDYSLKSSEGNHWVMFKKSGENYYTREKFHISLTRNKENIAQAFCIVRSILLKHNIKMFKVLKDSMIDSFEKNPIGKEIVIYIQSPSESDPKLWSHRIFPEVLDLFKIHDITFGQPSLGDIPIAGGEGFIYSRASFTALGHYAPAEYLESFGRFTAFESAHISSTYLWTKLQINDNPPISEMSRQLILKKQIPDNYRSPDEVIVKSAFDNLFTNNRFFEIATGFDTRYLSGDTRKFEHLLNLYGNNIGNPNVDRISKVISQSRLREEIFRPIFDITQEIVLKLRYAFEITTPVGLIYPALYEHFTKKVWESDFSYDPTSPLNLRAVIRDCVLCALRDGSERPAQPITIDDAFLIDLIDAELARPLT